MPAWFDFMDPAVVRGYDGDDWMRYDTGDVVSGLEIAARCRTILGDGANRWPALHTLDAATLYRLALEKAPASVRLHGVAEEGIRFRDIAEAIAHGLALPARSIAPDEAGRWLGFLGTFAQLDDPTSNARTREQLGWRPTHSGLLADIASEYCES